MASGAMPRSTEEWLMSRSCQSAFAAMFRGHFGVPPSAFYRGG